jgi:hypothetical protein
VCPHHPDTTLQSICDEDVCPKCFEEWIMIQPIPKKMGSYNAGDVGAYFASHLTHGRIKEFREKYKI